MAEQGKGFRGAAMRGAAAIGTAQAIKVALQMASTIVLSRLLAPTDFGVVAMVAPIVTFVTLFQDLGLQQAIIQAKEVSQEQISRMFWLNIGMSSLIAFVLILIGPLAGLFYGDNRVPLLTAAWAIPLLLSATAAQHLALLNRNLRFRTIATNDIAGATAGFLVSATAAWAFRSFWALWMGVAANAFVNASLAALATGWRPNHPRVKAKTGHLLRFGLNLAGFNFLNFFSRNLDNVIVAKFFGTASLGYYDRSYKLLLAPLQNINAPVGRVVSPILGRFREDPPRYHAAFMQAAGLVAAVSVPGVAALAIVSKDFVPLLLGERWAPAAPIFAWLGVVGVCQPIANATGWLFITQHRTQEMFRWAIFSTVTTVASFFAGLPWGPPGVAAAYAISGVVIRQPILFFWVGRRGPVTTRDLYMLQAPVAVSSVLCFFAMRALDARFALGHVASIAASLAISYGLAFALLMATPATRTLLTTAVTKAVASLRRRP